MGRAARAGRRDELLAAAFRSFARHGFRRTSMAEIAREAGVSRAALYLHFETKESLFRALVESLHDQGLREARAAAASERPLEERLRAILEAKAVRLFEALQRSSHAQDFVDENNRLCGDISAAAARRYERLITDTIARADAEGEIALTPAGVAPRGVAELLLATASGLKALGRDSLTTDQYRRRLALGVRVLLRGLTGRTSSRH